MVGLAARRALPSVKSRPFQTRKIIRLFCCSILHLVSVWMKGYRCLPNGEGRCVEFIKEPVKSHVICVFFEEKKEKDVLSSFILFPLHVCFLSLFHFQRSVEELLGSSSCLTACFFLPLRLLGRRNVFLSVCPACFMTLFPFSFPPYGRLTVVFSRSNPQHTHAFSSCLSVRPSVFFWISNLLLSQISNN